MLQSDLNARRAQVAMIQKSEKIDASMDESPVSDASKRADDASDAGGFAEEEQPLARVRYGIARELRLYSDTFVSESLEEREETRISLDNIRRVVLTPGEHVPSKLVLMFDLDDDNTVIVAEGMTNVRDFRTLLAKLHELRPEIELDPPDMDEQLRQALDIRRRSQLGCYGVMAIVLVLWLIFLGIAYLGAHAGR
jgi:hypothetical protein